MIYLFFILSIIFCLFIIKTDIYFKCCRIFDNINKYQNKFYNEKYTIVWQTYKQLDKNFDVTYNTSILTYKDLLFLPLNKVFKYKLDIDFLTEKNKLVLKILDRLIVISKSKKIYNSKKYQAIIKICSKLEIEIHDFSNLNYLLVPSKSELEIMNYYELSEYYTTLFRYSKPKQIKNYFSKIKSLLSVTLLNKIISDLGNVFILYNTNKFENFEFNISSSTLRYCKINNSSVIQLLPLPYNTNIIKLINDEVDYIIIYTDIVTMNRELILFLFNNISYIDLDYLML